MSIIARFKNWVKEQIEFEKYDAECRKAEAKAEWDAIMEETRNKLDSDSAKLKADIQKTGDELKQSLAELTATFNKLYK